MQLYKIAVVMLSVVLLSGCRAGTNSGLVSGEYAILLPPVAGPVDTPHSTVARPAKAVRSATYSATFPHDGSLESGKWTFVRGVRFPRAWLTDGDPRDHGLNLSRQVCQFLATAPALDLSDGAWVTQSGAFVDPVTQESYIQFVTLLGEFRIVRSSPAGAGIGARISPPEIAVFGAAALATDPGDPDVEYEPSHGVDVDVTVSVFAPSPEGGHRLMGSFKPQTSQFRPIPVWKTRISTDDNKLEPAGRQVCEGEALWFNNQFKVANIQVVVKERGR